MRTANLIHLDEHDKFTIKDDICDSFGSVLQLRSLYGDATKIYLEPAHIVQLRKALKDYTGRKKRNGLQKQG